MKCPISTHSTAPVILKSLLLGFCPNMLVRDVSICQSDVKKSPYPLHQMVIILVNAGKTVVFGDNVRIYL